MQQIRFWFAVALGAFLALFAVQNTTTVEILLLCWTFETSRFSVIAVTFGVGAAIGWIVKSLQREKRKAKEKARA